MAGVSQNHKRQPDGNPRSHGYSHIKNDVDLDSDDDSVLLDGDEGAQVEQNQQEDGIQKLPFFMISLILMCVGVSTKFHGTLVDQYVYQRFAIDIIGNATHTASDPCFHGELSNDTKTQHALVKHVQDLSSQKLLFLDLVLFGLGVPASVVLGVLSRSISRRLQLFIPLFGYNVKCASLVALVYFDFDLNWLFLPYAIEGCTGNIVGFLLGLFLYTSDISGRNRSRTTAMVIMEGIRGSTTAALNIVVGDMIQTDGFKLPAMLSMVASFLALALICVLPNRKPPMSPQKVKTRQLQEEEPPEQKSSWLTTFFFPEGTFDNPEVKKMYKSGLVAVALFLIAGMGMKKVQSLYLMNEPICWSSHIIGWWSFGDEMGSNLFAMFVGPQLIKCFPGMITGIIGIVSRVGGYIFLALATIGFQLYFQPLVSIGQRLTMGVIRGELSRLVGPEAQGPMFATIGVIESFGFAVGAGFLYVYNATLGVYKGTVAFLGGGVNLTAGLILIYFHRIWLKHYYDNRVRQLESLSVSVEKDGTSKRE